MALIRNVNGKFYSFRRDPVGNVGVGAEGFVFLPKYGLPPQLWRGPGTPCGSLSVLQAPPRVAPQLLWQLGPGGIPANQNDFLAALANPTLAPDIANPATYGFTDPAAVGLPDNTIIQNSGPDSVESY